MTHELDVELFISGVRQYPEIWDINCEENRCKNKKQAAWMEIAKVIVQDFETMSQIEQLEVCRKLFNKWRNIRDSYVRHVKRKDHSNKKAYLYAKHLTFLNSLYVNKEKSENDNEIEWSDEISEDQKVLLFKPKLELDVPEMSEWGDDNPMETKDRRASKRNTEEIDFVDVMADQASAYVPPAEDEDRSFFESLLPAVRNLDLDQKLEFRSEVLSLIRKIRNGRKKIKLSE